MRQPCEDAPLTFVLLSPNGEEGSFYPSPLWGEGRVTGSCSRHRGDGVAEDGDHLVDLVALDDEGRPNHHEVPRTVHLAPPGIDVDAPPERLGLDGLREGGLRR